MFMLYHQKAARDTGQMRMDSEQCGRGKREGSEIGKKARIGEHEMGREDRNHIAERILGEREREREKREREREGERERERETERD